MSEDFMLGDPGSIQREDSVVEGSTVRKFDPEAARRRREQTQRDEADARKLSEEKVDEELRPFMAKLIDPASEHKDRIEAIVSLQSNLLPALLKEVAAQYPNADRSLVATRSMMGIREVFKTLNELRVIESAEEINPHSPKFQLVLGWFIELLHGALVRQEADPILINNTFNDIAAALVGWEDTVVKKLKGVSSKALQGVKNPFVDEFFEKTKAPVSSEE